MEVSVSTKGFTKNEAALHTAEQEKFPLCALSNSEHEWFLWFNHLNIYHLFFKLFSAELSGLLSIY